MTWITTRIKWIILLAGVLTATMFYAAIAPAAAFQSTFGEALEGQAATLVVRNWGVLIALVGAMLIYGAFHPPSRSLVLTVAGLSKLGFVSLVFANGARYLSYQAGVAAAVDSVFVLIFAGYLGQNRQTHGPLP